MFFDLSDTPNKRRARIRQPPPLPDTSWSPPRDFPNLSAAAAISLDVETYDPTLTTQGPGWARGRSHVCGLAIAAQARDGQRGAWYFPVRHDFDPAENLDPGAVFGWARSVLDTPVDKIGANLTYDIGSLAAEGVKVSGNLYDVQFAEALIDCYATLSLDHLARKYTASGGKIDTVMYEWLSQAYGGKPNRKDQAPNIYRAPAALVAPYAIGDVELPLEIIKRQIPRLLADDLWHVFRLECDLIPLMIEMRFAGISVDIDKALEVRSKLSKEISEIYEQIKNEYRPIEGTATSQLIDLFLDEGIKPNTNANGNYALDKDFLNSIDHPLAGLVLDLREREKLRSTFIDGYILEQSVNGKLHPEFSQLRGEGGGTIVGRFSSSNPNLQNIPSRTDLGKLIRKCFVNDPGHFEWCKLDFSQIHYRFLAHFAVDNGDGSADALRQNYINNPQADYHDTVLHNVAPFMGWDTSDKEHNKFVRRPIKNVNFGLLYGQSIKALMTKTASYFGTGFTEQQARMFIDSYFKGAPYVKPTMAAIEEEVQQYGYVKTILNRRIYFNEYEPLHRKRGEYNPPLPYEQAIEQYGWPLVRSYAYRGVNYKFQGSEPDLMKTAMLKCYQSGVFDVSGVPRITLHDELDFSVKDDTKETREAFDFIKHTMEHAIPLRVPVFADESRGENWGEAD